jgi:hypothetical protein
LLVFKKKKRALEQHQRYRSKHGENIIRSEKQEKLAGLLDLFNDQTNSQERTMPATSFSGSEAMCRSKLWMDPSLIPRWKPAVASN